ncbi:hypothetical protein [Streptomyces sp. NPDC002738]
MQTAFSPAHPVTLRQLPGVSPQFVSAFLDVTIANNYARAVSPATHSTRCMTTATFVPKP